jgi:hypothetical protein
VITITHAGAARAITSGKIMLGGGLRTLRSIKVMHGGSLRVVASFVGPLSAVASPDEIYGSGDGMTAQVVVSGSTTATPTGGAGPYAYAWVKTGGATLSATNVATVSVSQFVPKFGSSSGTLTCTVTDSLGTPVECFVSYFLTNGEA